jgi:KaiC/GvpD/RAD55 family RecA-like ATPase
MVFPNPNWRSAPFTGPTVPRGIPPMSSALRLPRELREFLALRGPQSLIVKGPPGSGKTTLALAMLEAAGGERLLLSNRVTGDELAREFPWLGTEKPSGIEVVDATDWETVDPSVSHAVADASLVLSEGSPDRRDLFEFLSLPGPIQEAWSRLPSDGRHSTVVIDSWDALIEHYLAKVQSDSTRPFDRAELERRLLRRMGRSRTHLILILETDSESQLDYLVNGIVVTRRELVNDRLERWLSLPKLRGIRIANASYPYTVEGAKFQCIDPLHPYSVIRSGFTDPEPAPMAGFIWPGSTNFAEAFGRLAVGRVTLIEVDPEVPDYVVQHLLTPAKVHTVRAGGRVLVIPSPSLTSEEIWSPVEDASPSGDISNFFRVVDVSGQLSRSTKDGTKNRRACLVPTSALAASSVEGSAAEGELRAWVGGTDAQRPPGLVTMYETGIESIVIALKVPASTQLTQRLANAIWNSLGEGNQHLIAVGKIDSPLLAPVRALATIHLRLLDRQGRVLVYGLKPWTGGYVLTDSAQGGPYDLLRIV